MNSIGQNMPGNWRGVSEKNATDPQKLFRDNKVNVVVNADQTFFHLYPEEHVVIASKGVKRVKGKIKLLGC